MTGDITHKDVEHEVDRAITAREKACDQRLRPIEAAIVDIAAMRGELTTAVAEMKSDRILTARHDISLYGGAAPDDRGITGEMDAVKPILKGIAWGKRKIAVAVFVAMVAMAPPWIAAGWYAFKKALEKGVVG